MAGPLAILTNLTIILIIGIALTIVANRFRISNLLLLVLAGVILSKIRMGVYTIEFDPVFLTAISLLALVTIVFDSCSRFKLKDLDEFSIKAMKATLIWLVINMVILSIAVMVIFSGVPLLMALMFAALMTGTAPSSVLAMFRGAESRIAKFLEVESIANTPLIVIIPFIIIGFIGQFSAASFAQSLVEQVGPFLQQFVAGIGAGIVIGMVSFKAMSGNYSKTMGPLATLTASLLSYILAENLGGNGVLAVTTLGLFFGNMAKREREQLTQYSTVFANTLIILVFILIGLSVNMPLNLGFLMKSLLLFFIYLLLRLLAILTAFRVSDMTFKEKLFLAFNAQKGIAVATVAFSLTTFTLKMMQSAADGSVSGLLVDTPFTSLPGSSEILSLIITFIVYSLIFSTIIQRVSRYFIGEIIIPEGAAEKTPEEELKEKEVALTTAKKELKASKKELTQAKKDLLVCKREVASTPKGNSKKAK